MNSGFCILGEHSLLLVFAKLPLQPLYLRCCFLKLGIEVIRTGTGLGTEFHQIHHYALQLGDTVLDSRFICFGLTPMFNDALKSKVELVRVTAEIKKGDEITAGMITTVETGGYCMDCQRNMSTSGTRKKGAVANLVCGGYKLYGNRECTNHFIDYETLYDVVLQELRKQVRLSAGEKQEILDAVTQECEDTNAEQEKKKTLAALETRTKELDKIIQRLYEDNAAGKINDERLTRILATYEAEQRTITAKTNRQTEKKSNPAKESRDSFLKLLEDISEIDELTPDLLYRLIDHIEIGQGTYEESDQEGERGRKHQVVKSFYRFVGNLSEQTVA